jgi:hypothetical protein
MAKKQDWGKRNQDLSLKLLSEGVYFDWSVTTAFYSAVQYVEDAIFPVKINGIHCTEIGAARNECRLDGRHATREKLVYNIMGVTAGVYYKWLDDRSRTARYKTYKIDKPTAEKAKEYLCKVAEVCEKEKEERKKNPGNIKEITI